MCNIFRGEIVELIPVEGLGGLSHNLPHLRPDVHPQHEADVEIPKAVIRL
jgi:hypothetical protein